MEVKVHTWSMHNISKKYYNIYIHNISTLLSTIVDSSELFNTSRDNQKIQDPVTCILGEMGKRIFNYSSFCLSELIFRAFFGIIKKAKGGWLETNLFQTRSKHSTESGRYFFFFSSVAFSHLFLLDFSHLIYQSSSSPFLEIVLFLFYFFIVMTQIFRKKKKTKNKRFFSTKCRAVSRYWNL